MVGDGLQEDGAALAAIGVAPDSANSYFRAPQVGPSASSAFAGTCSMSWYILHGKHSGVLMLCTHSVDHTEVVRAKRFQRGGARIK